MTRVRSKKGRRTALTVAGLTLQFLAAAPAHPQQQDWVTAIQPVGSPGHQLEVARRLMRQPREFAFGPWLLLAEESLSTRTHRDLEDVARSLADSYRQRLKVEPTEPEAWFVLFDSEADYRGFRDRFGTGLTGATEGHATDGLAATYVGRHTRDHLAALVIHEGVHLINRATFRDRLPTWLDEGLATSMSFNRVDSRGRLLLGTIASRSKTTSDSRQLPDGRRQTTHRIRLEGPMAALLAYSENPSQWPTLSDLTDDWSRKSGRDLKLAYPQAGFFVRYLLDGADRDHQLAFRALLADLTQRPRPELIAALENRLPELEPGFRKWLEALADDSLARVGGTGPPPGASR